MMKNISDQIGSLTLRRKWLVTMVTNDDCGGYIKEVLIMLGWRFLLLLLHSSYYNRNTYSIFLSLSRSLFTCTHFFELQE